MSVRGDSTACGLGAMGLVVALLRSNGFGGSVSGSLEHPLIECREEGPGNPRTVLAFGSSWVSAREQGTAEPWQRPRTGSSCGKVGQGLTPAGNGDPRSRSLTPRQGGEKGEKRRGKRKRKKTCGLR